MPAQFLEELKDEKIVVKTQEQLIASRVKDCRWIAVDITSEGFKMKVAIDYKNNKIKVALGYIDKNWKQEITA